MIKKFLILLFIQIQIAFFGFSQNRIHSDTIKSIISDTMIVKLYNWSKLTDEQIYITGKLSFIRSYFYRNKKGYYGYFTEDKRGIRPKYEENKEFYSDGTLKEVNFTKGIFYNGPRKTYYKNGNLKCDCYFKNGKRDSIQHGHYESGQLQSNSNFKNNKRDGYQIWYYENGQLKCEEFYQDGKLLEIKSLIDRFGNPLNKGTLKNGNGTLNIYSAEGQLSEIKNYKNSKLSKTQKIIKN